MLFLQIIKSNDKKLSEKSYERNQFPEHPRMDDYRGVKGGKNYNVVAFLFVSILLQIIKSDNKIRPQKNCDRNQFPGTPPNGRL